jgi:small-conductance mechanosensitive channel
VNHPVTIRDFDQVPEWAIRLGWTLGTLAAAWVVGRLIKLIVIGRLITWASWTRGKWDEAIIEVVKRRITWWCVLIGAWLSTSHWALTPQAYLLVSRTLFALAAISVTLALAAIASRFVADYGARISPTVPVTTLSQNVAWMLVATFGILVVLNGLGVSITPMVTAFGIGGLAVALALQDPLANFFAGLLVTLARQVRIGDYIKLDSGIEGEIVDFNWRLTRIRTLTNKFVLVPNAKLAQAIVTNYSLPGRDLPVPVELGVDASCDLDKVERVVTDVGREVMTSVPGGVPESQPFVRFHTLGTSLIKFTVFLQARELRDQFVVTHEFMKRVLARFAREGIVIRV